MVIRVVGIGGGASCLAVRPCMVDRGGLVGGPLSAGWFGGLAPSVAPAAGGAVAPGPRGLVPGPKIHPPLGNSVSFGSPLVVGDMGSR